MAQPCEVVTSRGKVVGKVDPTGVRRFLGIPFASSGRFALPEPVQHGDFEALKRGPMCPQVPVNLFRAAIGKSPKIDAVPPLCSEEKCLNLNVVVPEGDGPFPVFVFFHGGAFVLGSNADVFLHGLSKSKLVLEQKVAVVCPNYRLGPLGWLQLPGVPTNLGLRDAVAALQWVQQEGSKFGLDTSSVMVGGESAGAMLTGAMLRSPLAKGLFQKAFLMSGTTEQVLRQADSDVLSRDFQKRSGVDLQQCSTLEMLQASAKWNSGGVMPFQPFIDGEVVTDSIQVQCEVLMGVCDNEYLLFMPHGVPTPTLRTAISKFKHELGDQRLDCVATQEEVATIVSTVQQQYNVSFGRQVARRLMSVLVFEAPCLLSAHRLAETNPVYLYRNMVGPAHAGELGYVFGSWNRDGINRWLAGLSLLRPSTNPPIGEPMEVLWSKAVSTFLRAPTPGPEFVKFSATAPEATELSPAGLRVIPAFGPAVDMVAAVSKRGTRPFGVKVPRAERQAAL
eukprot:CAMPEP_0204285720 /NCGR_PEP_ID=MMETSP0468-20130131/51287_1 /ASSEMBLY_ACC=CAM_ASM_000383 /TAXON_ID=2969 /ORGANISM="Oxyrrhis marina" /LENGTH=505 /DNA_ID=CAMNT_0051263567 /DNA_START=29 /DNA_END=1546 /DNA_ORIENTATION=-